jgi:alpha-L-fucosidase 2
MDNQILTHLFAATIESAEDLGLAAEGDVAEFRAVLARIAPPVIHSNGTLREWNEEFEETEIGHRHVSHLYALWPGQGISPDETPELAAAARRTLDRRLANGGGHTGWSRAWIVNFRARLRDGDEAWSNVKALLSSSTLPNLFDNHPPFQIDGNFGGLSGIVQMLMQSRLVTVSPADRLASAASVPLAELRLLPALPSAWPNGSARGLVARGGIVCDIAWSGGKLTTLSLTARHSGFGTAGRRVRIRYGDAAVELELAPGTNLIDVTRLA